MSDWVDDLDEDERQGWDEFVNHFRRDALAKMAGSAFVASIVPRGEFDVKFATELGAAIMLDKPILAIVAPGATVPEKLRLVATEVVEADLDLEDGREKIGEAIRRMAGQ